MNNLPAFANIPTPTPQIAASLSPQELIGHREKIACEVETVLSAYFQPSEREEIRTAQLAWWCDTLQDWTIEQVVYGLRKWNADNPRRRPTPGDVLGLLKRVRGEKLAAQVGRDKPKPEPERERVSASEAAEIMRKAGFAPRKMEDTSE